MIIKCIIQRVFFLERRRSRSFCDWFWQINSFSDLAISRKRPSAVLIVTPMVALIEDQMRELTRMCITSAKLALVILSQ